MIHETFNFIVDPPSCIFINSKNYKPRSNYNLKELEKGKSKSLKLKTKTKKKKEKETEN